MEDQEKQACRLHRGVSRTHSMIGGNFFDTVQIVSSDLRGCIMASSVPTRRDHMPSHRRQDIFNRAWADIEKLLPGLKGQTSCRDAFGHRKRWREMAARYAKRNAPFLAAVHIRWISLWGKRSDDTIWRKFMIFQNQEMACRNFPSLLRPLQVVCILKFISYEIFHVKKS